MREPQPSGSRQVPPPSLHTALGGTKNPEGHAVAIWLSRPYERQIFHQAFRAMDWEVYTMSAAGWHLHCLQGHKLALVVTDIWDKELWNAVSAADAYLSIVCDHGDAAADAFQAGADHTIIRPIDPDDPLGFTHSRPF